MQVFRYRDTTNVELEMYYYTSYNWSHRNSNEKFDVRVTVHRR
jgi:hypothetical protein